MREQACRVHRAGIAGGGRQSRHDLKNGERQQTGQRTQTNAGRLPGIAGRVRAADAFDVLQRVQQTLSFGIASAPEERRPVDRGSVRERRDDGPDGADAVRRPACGRRGVRARGKAPCVRHWGTGRSCSRVVRGSSRAPRARPPVPDRGG